jgi:hypothetical protein
LGGGLNGCEITIGTKAIQERHRTWKTHNWGLTFLETMEGFLKEVTFNPGSFKIRKQIPG